MARILCEMRKTSVLEVVWDTVASNNLLTYQGYHLGDVNGRSFRSRLGHDEWRIVSAQSVDTEGSGAGPDVAEQSRDLSVQDAASGPPGALC